ncbi:MAG: SDR family oxidoreductase [Alcaligenaceae bacterium]|nr:MAG: SDR family oxidoreductase [Alcaligenaceae bacterium]
MLGVIVDIEKRWALVTGASGGLGTQFAELLARQGFNLVVTSRGRDDLDTMATRFSSLYKIRVITAPIDFAEPNAALALTEVIDTHGINIDVLVCNAGQGLHGEFLSQPVEATLKMLQLNITSLTYITHLIATRMAKQGRGRVLLVASMTAYMPVPMYAAYGASKAYVRNFGEALHYEMRNTGVSITVVSPGLMDTGFLSSAGEKTTKKHMRMMMPPRQAAEEGLSALFSGKQSVVAGGMNRLFALLTRLISRRIQTKLAA